MSGVRFLIHQRSLALLALASSVGACALPHAQLRADGASADRTNPPDSMTEPDVVTPPEDVPVVPMDAARPETGADVMVPPDVLVDRVVPTDVGCPAGQMLCNGACIDTSASSMHCGACNNTCTGGSACITGTCTCPMGQTLCAGRCVTTSNDFMNCGMCGRACMVGQICSGGTCGTTCAAPRMMCGATCTDTQTDNANCGTCGTVCAAGRACVAGRCDCVAPTTDCGGACVNTTNNTAHCGRCSNACPVPTGGAATCAASACGQTCTSPMRLCGARCVAPTDITACGASCTMCAAPANGVATCNGTACGFTCNAGYMASGMTCIPIAADTCGNGTFEPAEACEDGNNNNNDGCSSTCTVEPNVFREACGSTAAAIPIRSGQILRFRGSTLGRNSDYMMCMGSGADVAFSVRAIDGGNLRVTVVSAMSWDIILRHSGGCPGSMCTDSGGNGEPEVFTGAVSGGSVSDFVIDGFNAGAGNFGVTISLM